MLTFWDLLRAAEPYGKIIEYLAIAAALLATIYSSTKIRAGAKEIRKGAREVQTLEGRLAGLSSKMMEMANEAVTNFEEKMDAKMRELTGQLADLVERGLARSTEVEDQEAPSPSPPPHEQSADVVAGVDAHEAHQRWWQPIVDMKFDDPTQEQPRLHWMNNTRTPLPWPGIWLTAWKNDSPDGVCGVALSGRAKRITELWRRLRRDADEIQRELPEGSTVEGGRFGIGLTKPNSEFKDDDEKRAWLKSTLNTFVNVLRPRIIRAANRSSQRSGDSLAGSDQQRQVN